MTTEPPIACALTAAEWPARRVEMAALAQGLLCADAQQTHAVLRFGRAPAARERLAAFVAGESRCCAFLRIDLSEGPDALTLTIDGPTGSAPVVSELVAALSGAA
jgi:hypothetical protein